MKWILLLSLVSCSQINQKSQDYAKKQNMRHGIIPLDAKMIKQNPLERKLDPKKVIAGSKAYKRYCLQCHGQNAEGNGPQAAGLSPKPKNLIEMAKQVPNFKFYIMVSQWQGKMPGWKSMLSKEEIESIEQFIINLAKK